MNLRNDKKMLDNEVFLTADGSHSLLSKKYGVSYHSKFGAIQETQHVFIEAALIFFAPQCKDEIAILDIGFGTGLNAYMTFLENKNLKKTIRYTAVEAFPISKKAVRQLNFFQILNQPSNTFFQMHDCDWEKEIPLSETFFFKKNKMRFEEIDFQNQFDVIYFDAFAPNAQPELWEENILQKMFDALKSEGVLTTYCAKGVVKRTFKKVGFQIEAIPGPPGKREMTRALKKN